jgi:hypothetical protein
MISDGVIAQLFAIAFLHVFPQCSVGIHVRSESIWTGNSHEIGAEILYRTIDRVGDKSAWTENEERAERNEALERRILAFRSRRYPQMRIFFAQCVKRA